MEIAVELIRRQEKSESEFEPFRRHMAEIAEIVRPLRNELRSKYLQPGAHRDFGVFDSTGQNANENLTGGLFGTFCNPADPWMIYEMLDEELNSRVPVKQWCEIESKRALKSATPAYSRFYTEVVSYFLDRGAFGNAVFSSELNDTGDGFVDKCRPLSECTWDVDADGKVDTLNRRWCMPGHVALRRFKDGLSQKTRDRIAKNPDHPVDCIHTVMPREEDIAADTLKTNLPFVSTYIEIEEKHVISKSAYYEFPYFVGRWEVAAGEKTGRGPGEKALADLRTLNIAQRDNIKAGNMAGNPPLGAPDEGTIQIRWAPGKVSYGAVNSQGKELLKPLMIGGNLPWSLEMTNAIRQAVKDAFYFSLLQLVGRTGMTATEVLELREERMRLLGPYGVGIQNDLLCPWGLRRFNMFKRLNLVRPPPRELVGRSLQVGFTSPFALAQKSAAANSTLRVVAAATALVQVGKPEVADRLNGDACLQVIQEGFGAPARILNDDDTTAQARAARTQTQAGAGAAQIADTAAGAAQKGAGALATLREASRQAA